MKPIAIINDTFNNYLYINFLCTTICNYKCSYCYPGCNDGKYRWPTNFELLKQNLGHMLDTYRSKLNKKSIRLGMLGPLCQAQMSHNSCQGWQALL